MSDIPAELAKAFRCMLMRVAKQLTVEEMSEIAYEEGHPNLFDLPPGSHGYSSMRVHFLHKLEAKGLFSPLNPDYLITILERVPKKDIITEVLQYKKHSLFPKAKKGGKDKSKKTKAKKEEEPANTVIVQDKLKMFEDVFAHALTHAGRLVALLEEVREVMQQSRNPQKLELIKPKLQDAFVRFSEEEETVKTLGRSLRKVLSDSGILADSPSSKTSSDMLRKRAASLPRTVYRTKLKDESKTQPHKKPLFPPDKPPLSSPKLHRSFQHQSATKSQPEDKSQMVIGHERLSKQAPPPVSPKPPSRRLHRQVGDTPLPVKVQNLEDDRTYDNVEFTGCGDGDDLYANNDYTGSVDSGMGTGGGDPRSWWEGSTPPPENKETLLYENLKSRGAEYMPVLVPDKANEYCLPNRGSNGN